MGRSTGLRVAIVAVAGLGILALVVAGRPPATPPWGSAAATPTFAGAASSPATTLQPQPAGTARASTASTPASSAVASVLLVGAGDIADCRSDGDAETASILDALPGATVFTLGDNAYEDGTRQQFDDCYGPTWGRHLDRTRPAPGNHDYQTGGAAGYFAYYGDRAGPDGRGYYAYDLGAWRAYSLNSNCKAIGGCGTDAPQVAWLREDLAAHPSRCTLAYWHHPRFSSGDHGSQAFMDPIWDVLYASGAEIVLAGHDHHYERFKPLDGDGDPAADRGITSFVVGTGGRVLYEIPDVLPTSVVRSNAAWGVLELTLSPDGWSSRFIPVAGGGFTDAASGACH